MIPEGDWEYFRRSPERAAQVAADEISYSWDGLIEKFNQNILGGTSHFTTNPRIAKNSCGSSRENLVSAAACLPKHSSGLSRERVQGRGQPELCIPQVRTTHTIAF
jgi:hypothetical protein